MSSISHVHAREVLDSRGNPTVEVDVSLKDGSLGRAIVPSGASTGQHEALELRDGEANRFLGKGVQKAIQNIVGPVAQVLVGNPFANIQSLDQRLLELDGTDQKSKLGANALLGVSLAFAHALAKSQSKPLFSVMNEAMGRKPENMRLPVPMMNVINGGEHANNSLEIQEFMIVPHGFDSFREALRAGCEVFQHLKKMLDARQHSTSVGDEGGFAPNLSSNDEALEFICEAIQAAGYDPRKQVSLALDTAASSFFEDGTYKIKFGSKNTLSTDELIDYYAQLLEKFPILSIEDGLQENDWTGWKNLTERFGNRVQLVGDDLFVTNKTFLQKGIDLSAANAVLVKVNQIGTLTETFETMNLAKQHGYRCVTSHRSGETEDTTIAHLAVGSGCGQIKTGSLSRGERTAKYNELLRIEEWAEQQGKAIPFSKF